MSPRIGLLVAEWLNSAVTVIGRALTKVRHYDPDGAGLAREFGRLITLRLDLERLAGLRTNPRELEGEVLRTKFHVLRLSSLAAVGGDRTLQE